MNNTLLAYAFNADKKLVHIGTVKNGLECNCICQDVMNLSLQKMMAKFVNTILHILVVMTVEQVI